MRFLFLLISLSILCFILQMFLPWWIFAPVCLLFGFLGDIGSQKSFLLGFLAVFLTWAGYALFLDQSNGQLLSEKIGVLFGGLPGVAIIGVGAFLAGIIGGLSALTGRLAKSSI